MVTVSLRKRETSSTLVGKVLLLQQKGPGMELGTWKSHQVGQTRLPSEIVPGKAKFKSEKKRLTSG